LDALKALGALLRVTTSRLLAAEQQSAGGLTNAASDAAAVVMQGATPSTAMPNEQAVEPPTEATAAHLDDAAVAQLLPGAESTDVVQMLSGTDDDEAVLYESDDDGLDAEPLAPASSQQPPSRSDALGSLRGEAAPQPRRSRWVGSKPAAHTLGLSVARQGARRRRRSQQLRAWPPARRISSCTQLVGRAAQEPCCT
jgi:hypothetical protein